MNFPIAIAQKSRLQHLYRRIGIIRGIAIFIALFIALGMSLAMIGWGWGDPGLLLNPLVRFGEWLTNELSFWKWVIGVLLIRLTLGPVVFLVSQWNDRFDRTPDSIYFNGTHFEKIESGQKTALWAKVGMKRQRLLIGDSALTLKLVRKFDPYEFSEMIKLHNDSLLERLKQLEN